MVWLTNWISKPLLPKRANWSGFMQLIHSTDPNQNTSSVIMMPLIDLQSSNPTCIYSTLLFIKDPAHKLQIKTPCVTFDQPLWAKATPIVEEQKMNIVCRLGQFHFLMSFLGSIGHLLEQIFAPNFIPHILSNKDYARSLRGHLLASGALLKSILDELLSFGMLSSKDIARVATYSSQRDSEMLRCNIKKINSQYKSRRREFLTAGHPIFGYSILSTLYREGLHKS